MSFQFSSFYSVTNNIPLIYSTPYIYGGYLFDDTGGYHYNSLTIFRKNVVNLSEPPLSATYKLGLGTTIYYPNLTIYGGLIYFFKQPNLYSINKNLTDVSANTVLTTLPSSTEIIKFDNTGTLYYSSNSNIYTINLTTGVSTLVCTSGNIRNIVFDNTNQLYLRLNNSTLVLYNGSFTTKLTNVTNIYYSNGYFSSIRTSDQTVLITDLSNNYIIPYTGLPGAANFVVDELNYIYANYINIIYISSPPFCFNEGTKILCLNTELIDEYLAIEHLQEGDFVKTFKHGYRKVIKTISGKLINNPKKWNMCMYKMAKTESNELIEDLIVTGGHSIMVDSITKEQQTKYDEMNLTDFSKITIDGKHLLIACVSEQFVPMPDNGVYTYYHLLLENNNDEEERFWIWANGILTETPNEKSLK